MSSAASLGSGETRLFIPGPAGRLELAVMRAPRTEERPVVVVCCHPLPTDGGTMTNKVIHTVAKTLTGLGLVSVRFNFRGAGQSEGSWDQGQGELDDARAVIAWAREQFPDYALWLAGFSFGAYISLMAAAECQPAQVLSVAPPVQRFDFSRFIRPACPWTVVMPEADEIVSAPAVFRWLDSLAEPPVLIRFPETGHFFHGKLIELRERLAAHYADVLPERLSE